MLPIEPSKVPSHRPSPASSSEQKETGDGEDYVKMLLKQCEERNDKLGSVVGDRLLGVATDLPASKHGIIVYVISTSLTKLLTHSMKRKMSLS